MTRDDAPRPPPLIENVAAAGGRVLEIGWSDGSSAHVDMTASPTLHSVVEGLADEEFAAVRSDDGMHVGFPQHPLRRTTGLILRDAAEHQGTLVLPGRRQGG